VKCGGKLTSDVVNIVKYSYLVQTFFPILDTENYLSIDWSTSRHGKMLIDISVLIISQRLHESAKKPPK